MELFARIALAGLLFGGVVFAVHRHDKVVGSYRYNALPFVVGAVIEAVLIWMAGGWG